MIALRTTLTLALLATALNSTPALTLAAEPESVRPQANSEPPVASQTDSQEESGPSASTDTQEESAPSATVDVTHATKYLFQGIDYSDGKPVFQPNFAATFADLSAGVWMNYQYDLNAVNEIDVSLKYTRSVQKLSITPGYIYLAYPNRDWDPSQELFVDLGLEAPLSPSLSLHYDVDAGQGLYATLGASHEVRAPVTVGANLFYQSGYYEMSGFPAAEFKVSATWSVGQMSVTPQISRFVTWGNRDFRDEAGIPSTWFFSVNTALPKLF